MLSLVECGESNSATTFLEVVDDGGMESGWMSTGPNKNQFGREAAQVIQERR